MIIGNDQIKFKVTKAAAPPIHRGIWKNTIIEIDKMPLTVWYKDEGKLIYIPYTEEFGKTTWYSTEKSFITVWKEAKWQWITKRIRSKVKY